jgi:hypothetical protein
VYNYDKKIADAGYPYAVITPTDWVESMYTSKDNQVTIGYSISIFVRNKDIATTEWTIRAYVDEILWDLRNDAYLTWTALSSNFDIQRWRINDEQPVRVATIKCNYILLICL